MNVISVAEGETGWERKRGGGETDRRVGKAERVGDQGEERELRRRGPERERERGVGEEEGSRSDRGRTKWQLNTHHVCLFIWRKD